MPEILITNKNDKLQILYLIYYYYIFIDYNLFNSSRQLSNKKRIEMDPFVYELRFKKTQTYTHTN